MNKRDFITKYRPRILLRAFNDDQFLSRNDIKLIERDTFVSKIKDFHCPWYYLGKQEKTFEEGVRDIKIRAMKIRNNNLIINTNRQAIIKKYQRKYHKKEKLKLDSIPIATDTTTNKTLILDSNKTCIALYRNYQKYKEDLKIQLVEIRGKNLENVIGDFSIVNRL